MAGVRLTDGRVLWVEVGDVPVAVLDVVRVGDGADVVEGMVIVTPEQLIREPECVQGRIVEVLPPAGAEADCEDLPGADMPPLGSVWEGGGLSGMVVGLDPVERKATIRRDDGSEVVVDVRDI